MKGLVLGIAIFLICIAFYSAVGIVAVGGNTSDFYALSLKQIITYFANNPIDVSFNNTLNMFESADKAIRSIANLISDWQFKTFNDDSDLNLLERIGAFFVWFGLLIGQVFNLIFQLVGVLFLFLLDIVETILWLLSIIVYLTTPIPKTVSI